MTTIFSAVLIIAIAISVTLVVILLNNFYKQKRANKVLATFNEAAVDFNLSISKMELLGSRIIGLDENNNKMLFIAATKKKYDGYLVDLDEIKTCTVKKEYEMSAAVYIKRIGVEAFVNRIVLQLDYKNGAQPLHLPFYDKTRDPIYEMKQRAEKAENWRHLLSEVMRKNAHKAGNNQKSFRRIPVLQ